MQSEVKSAAPRPLNGRVARLPIVRLELKDALVQSRRVLGCIRSRHFNDHARRLQGPRLHDDAPVRRTAQEEPAAVGADAQLSETQSHPVRGSPSQSTSLHHRSQEFVVASLEKLPKTGRKPVFSPKFASKRQFFRKKRKHFAVPRVSWDGTVRWGSQYGAWWCFTATTRMDPKFGMHLKCIGPIWTDRPDPQSNRGLLSEKVGLSWSRA